MGYYYNLCHSLDYAVQFDATRDREFYGLKEMKYYKDHVKGFFDFYKNFSFHLNVICTYTGQAIDKKQFPEKIEFSSMIISAPLLRRVNCAKYVPPKQLADFKEACLFSSEYLAEYKYPNEIMYDFEFYDDEKYAARHNEGFF